MIVAGTGHRPDKLGGYGDTVRVSLINHAQRWLEQHKPDLVISGMAIGWDQALAYAAYKCDIPFHAYVPFSGQANMWPEKSQKQYEWLLNHAAEIKYICEPGYAAWKMQKRNEAMVKDCDTVLAMWDGSNGGTANCIRYAEKQGKPIINIYNDWK